MTGLRRVPAAGAEEGHWDLPVSLLPLAVPALRQRPETLTRIFEALVAGSRECSGGKRTFHAPSGLLPVPLRPTWRPCPARDVGGVEWVVAAAGAWGTNQAGLQVTACTRVGGGTMGSGLPRDDRQLSVLS